MRTKARAYARIFIVVLWALLALLPLAVVNLLHMTPLGTTQLCGKILCFILGVRVRVDGRLTRSRKLLVVGNHTGYLDILALAAALKVTFVAKSDVSGWPLFGLIAKLLGTIFIRRDRTKSKTEVDMLERKIETNPLPIQVFPEGTSTDGSEVLPFKSALFSIFYKGDGAAKSDLLVQPIAITWSHSTKKFAWYIKEQTFVEHFMSAVKLMPVEAFITIGEPLSPRDYADRKALALAAQSKVKEMLDV